jgi:hypothetical protein
MCGNDEPFALLITELACEEKEGPELRIGSNDLARGEPTGVTPK